MLAPDKALDLLLQQDADEDSWLGGFWLGARERADVLCHVFRSAGYALEVHEAHLGDMETGWAGVPPVALNVCVLVFEGDATRHSIFRKMPLAAQVGMHAGNQADRYANPGLLWKVHRSMQTPLEDIERALAEEEVNLVLSPMLAKGLALLQSFQLSHQSNPPPSRPAGLRL